MAKMNFQPLYAQVRSALSARLTAGEWAPGAVLTGDSMLAAEMRVSPGDRAQGGRVVPVKVPVGRAGLRGDAGLVVSR